MMSEALKELSIIKDHIIKFAVQHDACNAYDLLSDKLLNING